MFLIESVDSLSKASHKYATQTKENCQGFIQTLAAAASTSFTNANANSQQPSTPTSAPNTGPFANSSSLNATAPAAVSSSNRSLNNNGSRQTLTGAATSTLDACQKLMIATNNLERVRESLKAYLSELDLDRYMNIAEKIEKTKLLEANRVCFEAQINQASDYMVVVIEYILDSIIVNKVRLFNYSFYDPQNYLNFSYFYSYF